MVLFDKKKLNNIQTREKQTTRHTIMLVDDVEGNLKAMASMLLDSYDLKLAHDGQEALDLLQKMEHPEWVSLIISDQRMPGLTGIELFERLIPIMPNTIRIIITAYTDIDVILESIDKAKIYKFIAKPFDPKDFLLTVKRAVEAFEFKRELDRYHQHLEQEVKKQSQDLMQKARELEQKNNEVQDVYNKLEQVRLSDPLTGFWNRSYLQKFIHSDMAKKPLASMSNMVFLLLDVDQFNLVNETHGYKAGDKVLKQFGDMLHKKCSESDILVRWGDEEFLMVSRSTRQDQALLLAEHLRQSIEDHHFDLEGGQTIHLTCSIGFACYPFLPPHPEALNWEQVVNIADQALYAAKKSGGNACVGLQGTDKTKPDNLYKRIRENKNRLLAKGELEALTSISQKTKLVWRKTKKIG